MRNQREKGVYKSFKNYRCFFQQQNDTLAIMTNCQVSKSHVSPLDSPEIVAPSKFSVLHKLNRNNYSEDYKANEKSIMQF